MSLRARKGGLLGEGLRSTYGSERRDGGCLTDLQRRTFFAAG